MRRTFKKAHKLIVASLLKIIGYEATSLVIPQLRIDTILVNQILVSAFCNDITLI